LPNVLCPTPPCSGTPVPTDTDPFGETKTASCVVYAGSNCTFQPRCWPHTGYWGPTTPIPIGTPVPCGDGTHQGVVSFTDTYEQCLLELSAGTSCRVGGWIDRLPGAVSNVMP
jgi:hypothetical protein